MRQVLPIVGAIIGAYFGNPQLGYAIGSIIGNAVDPQVIKGPKLGEAGVQTSMEGAYRPIVYGTAAIMGNVIVRVNRQLRTQRDQAGKGGGPITETQRVYWTFAIRACEAVVPMGQPVRIWMDEKLVYDVRPGSTLTAESAAFSEKFRYYPGGDDQLPDPALEAWYGVGNTPAYTGTAYFVFANFDLTDTGERIPSFRFEISDGGTVEYAPSFLANNWLFTGKINESLSQTAMIPWGASGESQSISSDGEFAAGGSGVFPYLYFAKRNSSLYEVLPPPAEPPVGRVDATAFHPSSPLLLVSSRVSDPNVYKLLLYSYDNDGVLTLESEFDGTGGEGGQISISPDGGRVAWATTQDSITRGLVILQIDQTAKTLGSPIYRDPLITFPQAGKKYNWSPNGNYLVEENNIAVRTWNAGTNPVTLRAQALVGNSGRGAYWVGTGILAISTSQVAFYTVAIDQLVGPTFPEQPIFTGVIMDSSESFDGNHIALATSGPEYPIWIYEVTSGLVVPIENQPDATFDSATNVSFAPLLPDQATAVSIKLSSIISNLHARGGHNPPQFDVVPLTDDVTGLVLADNYTIADAIRTLLPIYNTDASEFDPGSGYKVNYIKRGGETVVTLTVDDLVSAPEENTRKDPLEYPRVLHLHYQSPTVGYVPAKASPSRFSPDVQVVGEIALSVPVSFASQSEAWQVADVQLKIAWTEVLGEIEFSIPYKFLRLVHGDPIALYLRNSLQRLRITQTNISDGVIDVKAIADRQSAYTSNLTAPELPLPTPPPPSIVGQTVGEPMDLPALLDSHDFLVQYGAASGQTEAWFGARWQRDSGYGYNNAADFTINTIMGTLLDTVPAASEFYTDTTSVVRVELFTDDEIDSITEDQLLNGGNAFALKREDDSWEILQARDVVETDSRIYELSYLLRGRKNTQGTSHDPGTRFVLLPGVRVADALPSWIGQEILHRFVSHGTTPDGAQVISQEYVGRSQQEFPVAELEVENNSGTITVDIVARHRFGTDVSPVRSVNWDGFQITYEDSLGQSETIQTNLSSYDFDASSMTFPVLVSVSQLNRLTGPGPQVTKEVT